MPLQIGARDVAFLAAQRLRLLGVPLRRPRSSNTSWFLGGGADGGWFAYAPNTNADLRRSHGMDFYALGLLITGIASTDRRHQPDRHGAQHAGAGHER